jgi:hypothetical protein
MNVKRTAALCAGLVLSGAVAAATPAAPAAKVKSAKDIRSCMSDNLVRRAALRDLTLGVNDKEGKIRDLKLKLYWKPSARGGTRVHLKLVEPVAMSGSSYLLIQEGASEEVYFALPGADRALRITGQNMSEPLWGTDFSYGEIKQVMGLLVAGDTQKMADASAGGRSSYVLETATKVEETGYRKVVSYVDQASCVLLKSDFVAAGETPRKVLEGDVSTLLQADKYWMLLGYTMRDLSRGTYTTLALSDLTVDERLSERLFNPKEFFLPPRK